LERKRRVEVGEQDGRKSSETVNLNAKTSSPLQKKTHCISRRGARKKSVGKKKKKKQRGSEEQKPDTTDRKKVDSQTKSKDLAGLRRNVGWGQTAKKRRTS